MLLQRPVQNMNKNNDILYVTICYLNIDNKPPVQNIQQKLDSVRNNLFQRQPQNIRKILKSGEDNFT